MLTVGDSDLVPGDRIGRVHGWDAAHRERLLVQVSGCHEPCCSLRVFAVT
jgi:hypothetical protein